MPDMQGRTVLVTGASSGIGRIAAREFSRAGARTFLAVRDVDRGAAAAVAMPGNPEIRRLDVSDLNDVRRFAEQWTEPLDILVNNAGVMDVPLQRTREGFDVQTATNAMGPFLLTNLLLPLIQDRVVWVASQLHRMGHVHLEDLGWKARPYRPMDAYCDSKLLVVLFSLELQRQLTAMGTPVRSVIAHPGIATTTLAAQSSSNGINRLSFLLNDPEHGALPTLFAATQDVPGNAYVGPDGPGSVKGHPKIRKPGKSGLDSKTATSLWEQARRATEILTS